MQNAEVIGQIAELHGVNTDFFWAKLDRQARTVTDELTGCVYPIPDDWNLT